MRWSAALSAALHVTVVLLVYFGVPSLFSPDAPFETPIPVVVYTVAEETTPPPPPEPEPVETVETVEVEPIPEPEAEPDPVPPPPEPIEAVQVPPPPPEPMAAPEPVAVQTPPAPPPPPAATEPAQAPPPPRKPVQVARAEPPPAPRAKPKATPERNFDNLLVDLAAKPPKPRPAPKAGETVKQKPETPPPPAPLAAVTSRRNVPLSLSVVDAIRRQVEDNWNVPIGAPEAKDLVVEIRIVLQPDGTVTDAQIVDRARMMRPGEEFFRAMAESARRAVWRANPLRNLPPEQYDQWREITFTFRPPA